MAKKKKVFVEPEKDIGTMLYTSLMLILLTFFIVLCSMSVVDSRRQRLALNSLIGSFGILPGGLSPGAETGGGDVLPPSAPIRPSTLDIKRIRTSLRREGLINGVGVSQGLLGITITMKSSILFQPGSDKFKKGADRVLNVMATIFRACKNHIIIAGHTDSVPMEEPPFYSNWALSAARALAVMRYLSLHGIAKDRMVVYGFGSQRPITSNDTEYGRRLNRRVEITVVGDLPGNKARAMMEQEKPEPVKMFQYKGFRFRLEEQ